MLDAAGFDRVIVETVGAGQSEVEIATLADTSVVVCPPGLGDDVQAIKAGILEIADVLVVSKGDLPLAEQTARELREMLAPAPQRSAEPGSRASSSSARSPTAASTALLEALEAHALAVAAGRRRRDAAAARLAPVPDPATIAPGDADGWRARLQALAARDGLCATLGIRCSPAAPGGARWR